MCPSIKAKWDCSSSAVFLADRAAVCVSRRKRGPLRQTMPRLTRTDGGSSACECVEPDQCIHVACFQKLHLFLVIYQRSLVKHEAHSCEGHSCKDLLMKWKSLNVISLECEDNHVLFVCCCRSLQRLLFTYFGIALSVS